MGSRPSKLSPSMLGLRSSPREDPFLLKNQHVAQKSPIKSIVPKATTLTRVHENGLVTPRSHGRSAIYSMARTPYARVYPGSMLKVCHLLNDIFYHDVSSVEIYIWSLLQGAGVAVEGEPSSSARHAIDHDMLSGSKQGVQILVITSPIIFSLYFIVLFERYFSGFSFFPPLFFRY